MKRLTGKMRFAIFASVLWFGFWLMVGWFEGIFGFTYTVGVFPLIVVWGIWWVWQGFKKDKDE